MKLTTDEAFTTLGISVSGGNATENARGRTFPVGRSLRNPHRMGSQFAKNTRRDRRKIAVAATGVITGPCRWSARPGCALRRHISLDTGRCVCELFALDLPLRCTAIDLGTRRPRGAPALWMADFARPGSPCPLQKDASEDEIRKAYKRLALRWHPGESADDRVCYPAIAVSTSPSLGR